MRHTKFASNPRDFIQGFLLLERDLETVFEYLAPSESNAHAFGYRIHQLLLRCCIEIEANLKAILIENKFDSRPRRLTMKEYSKIETSHHLSSYEVILPSWKGLGERFRPFEDWKSGKKLKWYEAYNAVKHDRYASFSQATLENLVKAVGGLLVLLTSQFGKENFSGGGDFLGMSSEIYLGEDAIGSLFRVIYPVDWTLDEKYDFDWRQLSQQSEPFARFDFDATASIQLG